MKYIFSIPNSKNWGKKSCNNQIHQSALKGKLKYIGGFADKSGLGNKTGFVHKSVLAYKGRFEHEGGLFAYKIYLVFHLDVKDCLMCVLATCWLIVINCNKVFKLNFL